MDYNIDITNLINNTLTEVKSESTSIEITNRFYIQKFKRILLTAIQNYASANTTSDTIGAFNTFIEGETYLANCNINEYERTAIKETMSTFISKPSENVVGVGDYMYNNSISANSLVTKEYLENHYYSKEDQEIISVNN